MFINLNPCNKRISKLFFALITILSLIACDSNSNDAGSINAPIDNLGLSELKNQKIMVRANNAGSFSYDKPNEFKDNNGNFFLANGCLTYFNKTDADIYSNGYIYAETEWKKKTYKSLCHVEGVIKEKKQADSTNLGISYAGKNSLFYVFYDNINKDFYEVGGINLNHNIKEIISIKNDGMSVEIKDSTNTLTADLKRIYSKQSLSDFGINLHKPKNDFYKGDKNEIMEVGVTSKAFDKPYNLSDGYLYKYSYTGCDLSGTVNYIIYNDGLIYTSNINNGDVVFCNIKEFFEKINLTNDTNVNANKVNSELFYDSETKIYYELDGSIHEQGSITKILNDGVSAAVDSKIYYIKNAYRKIEL